MTDKTPNTLLIKSSIITAMMNKAGKEVTREEVLKVLQEENPEKAISLMLDSKTNENEQSNDCE